MPRKPFIRLTSLSCGNFAETTILLLATSMLLTISSISAQQISSPRLEGTQANEIAGVKFTTPQGFTLTPSSETRVALMHHATEQLALFVAVPEHQVDDKYLTDLSNDLVSRLFPQQNDFAWKILQRTSERRVSKYQTNGGTAKGLNGKRYVQTDYVIVKVQEHEVVVGSIATFGNERDAKFLFDVEGREYSLVGWQALFELIASVTGEIEQVQ